MPVQPIDIIQQIGGLRIDDTPDVNIAAFSSLICYTHILIGDNDCATSNEEAPGFTLHNLYIRVDEWNPPTAQNTIVSEENEAGEKRVKLFRQKRFISCQLLVNNFYLNALQNFELYQKWTISRVDGGDFELSSFEVGQASPQGNGYHTVTITMGIKGGDSVVDSCCGSAYEGAPYEDCTDAEGLPQPPEGCDDYEMNELVYDAANKTLTASTTGQPADTVETFKWYYFRDESSPVIVLSNTAAVITVTDPGTYRAIATAGVCQTPPEDFLLMDDCEGYDATIYEDDGYIVLQPNRISDVVWTLDGNPIAETDLIFRPDVSGTYEATVTAGDCEVVKSIVISIEDCDFAVGLSESADVLTATITGYEGSGTATYKWFLDTGSGETEIVGAVASTYTVLEAGNYIVEVSLDGCTKRANIVQLGACYGFNPFIEYVIPDGLGGIDFMSGHTGAPGDVDVEWYQIRSGQWTLIGSGSSLNTDQEGPTKMVAISDGCRKERFTQACVDPSAPEWEERETATASQTVFDADTYFTEVDLANISAMIAGGASEEDIGAEYELYKNGARLVYKHIANLTHRSEWSVNGDGDIELSWPSNAGDVYVLVRRYIP